MSGQLGAKTGEPEGGENRNSDSGDGDNEADNDEEGH